MEKSITQELINISKAIENYKSQGLQMFATSSFQTHSIPMLHILSEIDKTIPVYFINTGFHFPESLYFRDKVSEAFGLNLIDLQPLTPKNLQRDLKGNLYFTSDPDYCCYLNKIQPMDIPMAKHDVWINGIRADQNANRKSMGSEMKTPDGKRRYHPMLNWTNKMIFEYASKHKLPKHPLESKGYLSIGCEPCTQKFSFDDERSGRWKGMKKTECGLHTDLVKK